MKKVVLAIAIIIVMLLFVSCNIKMYGIYYAKYTPHTGTSEPVLQMLVDNMKEIDKIEGFRYSKNGANSIVEDTEEIILGQVYSSSTSYIYIKSNEFTYYLDRDFAITRATDGRIGGEVYNLEEIDREVVISSIYTTFQPIIDAQPSPLINLQWIFDIVYHNKFN